MRQAICYMPAHSHQRTNHQRDTYSRICLGHRSVNVTQRAYSCLAPCNKPGRYRADLLVSLLRISFLHHDSAIQADWPPTEGASRGISETLHCLDVVVQERRRTIQQVSTATYSPSTDVM